MLTVIIVIISGVGVIMAAMMRIKTIAYRRDARMKWGVMTPTLDRIRMTMGNSKTMPQPSDNVATNDKYEPMVMVLVISGLME